MYRVLTDYNTYVWLKEEDIENSIKDDFLLKREIIMAMGMTHNKKYLKYLYPYLNNEVFYKRREAAQSIFLIDGEEGLENLKKRESQLDDIEYNDPPSEKALLKALIIRIENGVKGSEEYFFSDTGNVTVKYAQLACYSRGYLYQEEDIALITKILEAYVEKKSAWIKKLSKSDYLEAIYFTVQSIWYSNDETQVMQNISDKVSEQLCEVFKNISEMRVSSDVLEMLVDISAGLREKYALYFLRILKGKTRGDAQKAYKKALKKWNLTEDLL